MRNCIVDTVSVGSGWAGRKLMMTAMIILSLSLPSGMLQAETRWTPYIDLSAVNDDNILFTETDPVDDYIYSVEPGLTFNYDQELTQITADGSVLIRRYQDNDDLDDENYRFDFNGKTNFTERFGLEGGYNFTKDTTLDSELEETGRITIREERTRHDAALSPNFDLTERTNIGVAARYRNVDYDSDIKVDYTVWDFSLPVRWNLVTQVDTIFIDPGYTYRDSDTNRSNTYNFRIGWDHQTTERLTLNLSVGARLTEHERLDTGETEDQWGALGALKFNYAFETGNLNVDFLRDLKTTASGEQADVSRVSLRLRWRFTERLGADLVGRYYYTKNEGQVDDNTTELIRAGPGLNYNLTENHVLYIAYEYSQETLKDVVNEPTAERNQIWAGLRFNFSL